MAQRRQSGRSPKPLAGENLTPADPSLTRESVQHLLPESLAAALPQALLKMLPARLGRYLAMLLAWNRAINLTGGRSQADILTRLIPDSFQLAAFLGSAPLAGFMERIRPAGPRCLDLGAGNGLPGIPLRMVWEAGEYALVEAREKRALFLANALATLNMPRVSVFRGKAEAIFAQGPHEADLIISRAFLPWPKLLPFCQPGLAPKGMVIIFASEACGTLPAPWRLVAETDYAIGDSRRWLWALQQGEADHA